jgi:hypothetical protein
VVVFQSRCSSSSSEVTRDETRQLIWSQWSVMNNLLLGSAIYRPSARVVYCYSMTSTSIRLSILPRLGNNGVVTVVSSQSVHRPSLRPPPTVLEPTPHNLPPSNCHSVMA